MVDFTEGGEPTRAMPAMPRVTLHSPNLDGLLVVIIQHWRWIVATPIVFGIAVLLALPFLTTSYEISASVLVKLGREQSAPPLAGSGIQAAPFKRTEDVTSEIEILKSEALIEQLVNSFGVDYFTARKPPETFFQYVKSYARTVATFFSDAWSEILIHIGLEKRLTPFQKIVSVLDASLKADAVKRADVIDVTLLASDPDAGVTVLTRLLQLYQAEHIRVYKTPGATEFLGDKVASLKQDLQKLEAQRRSFGEQDAIWDLEEQRKLLLQRQQDARIALSRDEEDRSRLKSEIDQGAGVLKLPPGEIRTTRIEQSNPAAQALETRIAEHRVTLAKLHQNYADDSTRVRDEEAEIASLEALSAKTPKLITQSETFETVQSRRDTERAQAERLNKLPGVDALIARRQQNLQEIAEELGRLDARGEESRKLQRESSLVEQSYQLYARRLDEAQINEALDSARISNVAVIGAPTASFRPVRPKPIFLFLVALGAGLVGSIGVFLLRDALRPVIHSRERAVDLLGAPVLGRLPEIRS